MKQILGILIMVLSILLTVSRSGVACLIGGLLAFGWFVGRKKGGVPNDIWGWACSAGAESG